MTEDYYFLRKDVVDVDAAVVGIGENRWVALHPEEATEEQARQVMNEHQFDVLPVAGDGTEAREYFATLRWNDFTKVERYSITFDDVIPFDTPLRSVIKGFVREERLFYFLTNEERVVGLISIVNLNCRQARIFLFSLLSELEIRLGALIGSRLSEEEILATGVQDGAEERYRSDRKDGVDTTLIEYLYLSDLINIARKQDLYEELGFPSRSQFEKAMNPVVSLRNDVAHPTRSLIDSVGAVKKLWERILTVERCLFQMRQLDGVTA